MNTAPYPVTITQAADRTLIARVGCKTLTFPDTDTLLYELRRYLEDPSTAIHEYAARYGWLECASPSPAPAIGGLGEKPIPSGIGQPTFF